jgi:hypothetical protein
MHPQAVEGVLLARYVEPRNAPPHSSLGERVSSGECGDVGTQPTWRVLHTPLVLYPMCCTKTLPRLFSHLSYRSASPSGNSYKVCRSERIRPSSSPQPGGWFKTGAAGACRVCIPSVSPHRPSRALPDSYRNVALLESTGELQRVASYQTSSVCCRRAHVIDGWQRFSW